MSVMIKGVEKPKSCGNCFYTTQCDRWRQRNWGAPPPSDCPIAGVPPHGRLIDADALIQDKGIDTYSAVFAVANAPTIIPAEEE